MKRITCSAMLLLLAAAPGFAQKPLPDFLVSSASAQAEVVGTQRDANTRAVQMQRLQERLAASRVDKALTQPVVIQLTASERNQINDLSRVEKRYQVGISRTLAGAVASSVANSSLNLGATRSTREGSVTTTAIRVPGATALRLHLTGVDLPRGAELYVYNLAGQAFGPYTGRGPLGNGDMHTNTVFGEQLLLQLHTPADAPRAPRLNIAEVGIMGARFAAPRYGPKGVYADDLSAITAQASNLCSNNADCIVNAACQSSAVVNTVKDAVATILFQSGASFYICTGGLIADNVTTSVIPFFLTAHHCISTSGEASSVETYFDYATTCSSPNCTQPYNNTGETVGSTIKASSSTSDVTLLQLASSPTTPDGVAAYLGWTNTPVANTNNLALYRISHPSGSPQAYTEGVVDTTKGTCRTLARGNFIYSRDTLGGTEGGSSGSPVVNASSQIVGQLYGACGTNVNNSCDAAANATVDGAFAVSYSLLAPFLNPGSGGGCAARGASCTLNSQCCSNSCVGKTGAKTCK
ncbi:MAG TPA: trypsin-like peptidase domain-containing protein [Thermoanaerobaculia bacterium]|nr:trypsin-like peptidase domain-containing protein [Thermoanaerobaculia bacterium]